MERLPREYDFLCNQSKDLDPADVAREGSLSDPGDLTPGPGDVLKRGQVGNEEDVKRAVAILLEECKRFTSIVRPR